MRLLPEDLPLNWFVRFAQARGNPALAGAEPPQPRLGILGPWLSSGTGLDRVRAAHVLPTIRHQLIPWLFPFSIWSFMSLLPAFRLLLADGNLPGALACMAVGGSIFAAGLLGARASVRRLLSRPVAPQEVECLLARTTDASERQFLELVRDAVRQPLPREAEESVREAIESVAEAIARLPAIQRPALDTAALRREATEVETRAAVESDPVMAESLRRRAAAILHRVNAHERSALVVARAEMLRAEIEAQVAALREGLAAFDTPSPDPGALASLAEAARQVAAEAGHVSDAREELETESLLEEAVLPLTATVRPESVEARLGSAR